MLRHNSLVRVIDGARKSLSAFFEKFLERRLTHRLSGGGGVHEGRAGVCSRQCVPVRLAGWRPVSWRQD